MNKVSNAEKAGVVARVAKRQVKRSRTVRAVTAAVATTARATGKVVHQLWMEAIGMVFLVMALSGAVACESEYRKYRAGHAGFGHVLVAICFTLTFLWFGLSSFWKVRRKDKAVP